MLDQLVSFNWGQISSHFITTEIDSSMILDWGYQLLNLDQIFWSVCSQIEYLSTDTSWYIVEPWPSSKTPPSCIFHSNGWSVRADTGRLRSWPEQTVECTLQPRCAVPHFISLEAAADALSSHCCYADDIWFYRSHSSTGETFHL